MRITFAALLLAIGLVGQAFSQELGDDAYVNDYFGTSAVVFTTTQLVNENQWWTDLLPQELVYGSDYVSGLVNAYRIGKGVDQLIPLDTMVVEPGWEVEVEGGYEYNLDFVGMRPSEVEFILTVLGGIDSFLGEVSVSYRPLTNHYHDVYSDSLDAPVEITIGSQVVEIDITSNVKAILKQLGEVLTQEYGAHTINDITLSYSIYDGTESVFLSFNVELPAG